MMKKVIFVWILIILCTFSALAGGSSSSSSSSSSSKGVSLIEEIYPTLSKVKTYLENNNIEGAKSILSNASRGDKQATLYAVCEKGIISGFNYQKNSAEMVKFLITRDVDVNETEGFNFPTYGSSTRVEARKAGGNWTPLMYASNNGFFDVVVVLLDNGAKINLRNDNGSTALSLAYDRGEIEIYNYLKEHGAMEFEPRQIAQQPAAPSPSPTPIIIKPSTPAPSAPAQPATPTFQTGTYACNRTNITMSLNLGLVTAYSGRDVVGYGTYKISGNQLAVTFDARTPSTGAGALLRGNTYIYTLTSNSTFSGNGEDWMRTGY